MKGSTMLATLQALGVAPSYSRPAVSNDNPFSESLFKTLKYRPAYPRQAFEDLGAARRSEEHTSELQSLMRISYAVFCLKKQIKKANIIKNMQLLMIISIHTLRIKDHHATSSL